MGGGHYPDPVPGPNGNIIDTWHIDEDGGFLHIYVPNDPRLGDRKVIFIQLTSDKGALLGSPVSSPEGTVPYPKSAIKHSSTSWYTYTAQIDIPFNPPEEYITYHFPESTNISELVIDTICLPVPEPTTWAMIVALATAGCAFSVGRRSRESYNHSMTPYQRAFQNHDRGAWATAQRWPSVGKTGPSLRSFPGTRWHSRVLKCPLANKTTAYGRVWYPSES